MASLLVGRALPALNEGDERISLADMLAIRDTSLTAKELWAVCLESCLAIQGVSNSPEMFQTLCITPDSLAFDSAGAAYFLDLASDPEPMYVPPEYENIGNSYKAHLYSLGMTLLFGAEYSQPSRRSLPQPLHTLINHMIHDEYDQRASLHEVLEICQRHLQDTQSSQVCCDMVLAAREDLSVTSDDDEHSLSGWSEAGMLAVAGHLVQDLAEHSYDLEEIDQGIENDLEDASMALAEWQRCTQSPIEEEEPGVRRTEHMGRDESGSQEDLDFEDSSHERMKGISSDVETCHVSDEDISPEVPSHAGHVSLVALKLRAAVAPVLASAGTVVPSGVGGVWEEAWTSAAPAIQLPQVIRIIPEQSAADPKLTSSSRKQHATASGDQQHAARSPDHRPCVVPVTADGLKSTDAERTRPDMGPGEDQGSAYNTVVLESAILAVDTSPTSDFDSNHCDRLPDVHHVTEILETASCASPSNFATDITLNQVPLDLAATSSAEASTPTQIPASPPEIPSLSSPVSRRGDGQAPTGNQTRILNYSSPSPEQPGGQALISPGAKPTVTYLSVFGRRDQSSSQSVSGIASSCRDGVPPSMATENRQPQATSPAMDEDTETREPAPQDPGGGSKNPPTIKDKNMGTQCIQYILEKLGCGLPENELWALCRQCVMAFTRNSNDLPAYISLETVSVDCNGEVVYGTVPEEQELEVVYLAPELQEHGIVTEKSCLFGIAAMLWLAADYKLPANQEPALSDKLEALLISMTQDDQNLRPTASHVLEACSAHEQELDISCQQVCQALFTDANKAAAFGKTNVLVQGIISKDIKKHMDSTKADILDRIRSGQLNANLKPVSERQLKDRPVEMCLHDELRAEITQPRKKLRKTSKPREMEVKEIFVQNPEFMRALIYVTSSQSRVRRDASPWNKSEMRSPNGWSKRDSMSPPANSAFSAVGSHGSLPSLNGGRLPSPYQSQATHFKPIVLSGTQKAVTEDTPGTPGSTGSQTPKDRELSPATQREKRVAQKLKELKKSLLNSRTVPSMVQDVENDVNEPHYPSKSPKARSPYHPGISPGSSGSGGQRSPHTPHTPTWYVSSPCSPPVLAQSAPPLGVFSQSTPNLPHLQYPAGTVIGTYGQPTAFMQPTMASSGGLPMQVQLQPDPNTGLYHLMPVAVNPPPPMPAPVSPVKQPPTRNDYVTYDDLLTALKLKDINTESDSEKDKRRYVKHVSKLKMKESKLRSRTDASLSDRERDSNSGYVECESNVRSSSQSRNRHRSRTLGSLEMKGDIEEALDTRGTRQRHSYRNATRPKERNLHKANSMEILDPGPPPCPSTNARRRLHRTKSGSAIDYKNICMTTIDIGEGSECRLAAHSKSNPNLQQLIWSEDRPRRRSSPIGGTPPESPSSPSLSRDSGVSGLNLKTGDAALMERLLNSDTIRHQQKLSKTLKLLREEFAYDGYMENGIEDLAMSEYVLSLANLSWSTFNNAITEKYCDLFWQEELLVALFEAVNGCKPIQDGANNTRVESQTNGQQHQVHPANDGSGFRPIIAQTGNPALGYNAPVFKPRAKSSSQYTDTSDSTTDGETQGRQRRYRKKAELDKCKSASVHDLLHACSERGQFHKSHSEDMLRDSHVVSRPAPQPHRSGPSKRPAPAPPQPYQRHGSEGDTGGWPSNGYPSSQPVQRESRHPRPAGKPHQNGSYLYRYDSDSSAASDNHRVANNLRNHNKYQQVLPNKGGLPSRDAHGMTYLPNHATSRSVPSLYGNNRVSTTESTDSYDSDPSSHKNVQKQSPSPTKHFRGCVMYYAAEMAERLRPDVQDFARNLSQPRRKPIPQHPSTREGLETKMLELDQQMIVEHRMKKKTLKFYTKLMDASKANKASPEQKNMLLRMSAQLHEMSSKLTFLDAAKKHLEMLYAEQWSLPVEYLYTLARGPGDSPMLLAPSENPLLQYQVTSEGQLLQAGTPQGLMSYLYTQHALSDGFIHYFFYIYRYFASPQELFDFLRDKYTAASLSLSPEADIPVKVKARSLHLLQAWIEGYFSVDFKHDSPLTKQLYNFIKEKVIQEDNNTEFLLELLEDCQDGRHTDLHYPQFLNSDESQSLNNNNSPKKWESFKAALHLSAKPVKLRSQPQRSKTFNDKRGNSSDEIYSPGRRQPEAFSLADYTSQMLAEQLTLRQQELFRLSHPVHYLNSKAQGITATMANNNGMAKSPSQNRLNTAWEDNNGVGESSLFAGTFMADDIIQQLMEDAQGLSFWAAAEVLTCTSTKAQVSVLTKLIYVAKICHELRNYATCIAILDGLENIIVRQVPAWRSLPSKCMALMEELASVRVFLQTDSQCLVEGPESRHLPTLPCTLLFLLHIQQLEIGGFRLANGMFRWAKMKKIGLVLDQVRVFREQRFNFVPQPDLVASLRMRMRQVGQHDLASLATQHNANFTKVTSSRIGGAFRRMRDKLQGKGDG